MLWVVIKTQRHDHIILLTIHPNPSKPKSKNVLIHMEGNNNIESIRNHTWGAKKGPFPAFEKWVATQDILLAFSGWHLCVSYCLKRSLAVAQPNQLGLTKSTKNLNTLPILKVGVPPTSPTF